MRGEHILRIEYVCSFCIDLLASSQDIGAESCRAFRSIQRTVRWQYALCARILDEQMPPYLVAQLGGEGKETAFGLVFGLV